MDLNSKFMVTYNVEGTLDGDQGNNCVIEEALNIIRYDVWNTVEINISLNGKLDQELSKVFFKELYFTVHMPIRIVIVDSTEVEFEYDSSGISCDIEKGVCLGGKKDEENEGIVKQTQWLRCSVSEKFKVISQPLFVPLYEGVRTNQNGVIKKDRNQVENIVYVKYPSGIVQETFGGMFFGSDVVCFGDTDQYSGLGDGNHVLVFLGDLFYDNMERYQYPWWYKKDGQGNVIGTRYTNITGYTATGNVLMSVYTEGVEHFDMNHVEYNKSEQGSLIVNKTNTNIIFGLKTMFKKNNVNGYDVEIYGYQYGNDDEIPNSIDHYNISWCYDDGQIVLYAKDNVCLGLVTTEGTDTIYANTDDAEVEYHFKTPFVFSGPNRSNEDVVYNLDFRYYSAAEITVIHPVSQNSAIYFDAGIVIEKKAVVISQVPVHISGAGITISGTLKAPICIIE